MIDKQDEIVSDQWMPHMALMTVITIFWIVMPIPATFLFLIYSAVVPKSRIFCFFMIALSFGLIAYTGKSVGEAQTDLFRYYQAHQKMTGINSLEDLLYQNVILNGEINILFILFSYALAKIFPTNPQVFALFWVTVGYFFVLLTFYEFLKQRQMDRMTYVFTLLMVVILGIPFVLTVEIIKQCVAVSILTYAILLRINDKKVSWLFGLISVLIHMSSLMLVPILFFSNSRKFYRYLIPVLLATFFFSAFNINELLNEYAADFMGAGMKERAEAYSDYGGWELSRRYYLILIVYVVLIGLLAWVRTLKKKDGESDLVYFERLLTVHILACCILLVNRGNIHNFVRYILGYYPFYILLILCLYLVRMKKKEWFYLVLILALFFDYLNILLLQSRTDAATGYANSFGDNNIVFLVRASLFDYLNYTAYQFKNLILRFLQVGFDVCVYFK